MPPPLLGKHSPPELCSGATRSFAGTPAKSWLSVSSPSLNQDRRRNCLTDLR